MSIAQPLHASCILPPVETLHPVEALARGWCPGLARPMASGDGLLARVHPPLGSLTCAQARAIAEAAHLHGNGLVDITSHANVQIRGVRAQTHAALRAHLAPLGLDDDGRPAPFRATVLSPLGGLDGTEHVDGRALAQQVEAMAGAVSLPPKFLIVVDSGGAFPLTHLRPDLRLLATAPGQMRAELAGKPALSTPPVDAAALIQALPLLLAQLSRLLACTGRRRVRLLTANARRAALAQAGLGQGVAVRPRTNIRGEREKVTPPPRAGRVPLKDGRFALFAAPPFGQMATHVLEGVARLAEESGLGEIRLTPLRGLMLPGLAAAQVPHVKKRLSALGLITRADDNRLRILTCAGAPACARALCNSHVLASQLAAHLPAGDARQAGADEDIHLSACAKGCARRKASALTLVASGDEFAVIPDGGPLDTPLLRLPFAQILHRLAHSPSGRALRDAF